VPTIIPVNNAPEVELDNSGLFGVKVDVSTTPIPGTLSNGYPSTVTQNTGYRINEYYDNGGRGTIKYNNGFVANKMTESDIQDYRTSAYTRLPNSFIISAGKTENEQSVIQKTNNDANQANTQGVFTKEGFTKTGPTRTGITTAQVGGSGSYVIGSSATRIKPNPQHIGEQAFAGSFGTTGSKTNLGISTPGTASTNNELLKYTTASDSSEFTGYSYPRPLVEVEVQGKSNRPNNPQTTYQIRTTASPNIEQFDNQNSVIIHPDDQNNRGFSTTSAPFEYTTNSLERFRTTIQQISTLPQTISTNKPEFEAKFGIGVTATPVPKSLTTQKQRYQPNNLSTKPDTYLDVGVSFNPDSDYISTLQGSTGSSDYSDITANFDQGNFGQKIAGKTLYTNINYQQPTTNAKAVMYNIFDFIF
jgi:hypothetical protein